MENVHDGVEIINQHPTGVFGAFRMNRHGVGVLFHFLVNAIGNSLDVGAGVAFANDEKIGWGFAQFPQIQLDDIFAFLVANTFDNGMVEFFEVLLGDQRPAGCCPNQVLFCALVRSKKGWG